MMLFHDFHIKFIFQHRCNHRKHFLHHRYTEGKVCLKYDGNKMA